MIKLLKVEALKQAINITLNEWKLVDRRAQKVFVSTDVTDVFPTLRMLKIEASHLRKTYSKYGL